MFTSILVAVDGSKQSVEAIAAACSIAELGGGHICLVSVPQPVFVPIVDGTMGYPLPYDRDDLDRDAKATLDKALAIVPEKLKGRTSIAIVYGDP
ncbi:MAG: universal stress protein, partial [Notoacmeibacter sp.]